MKLDTLLSERGEIFIEPPPPVTRAHPGHGSTFHLSDGIPYGLQPETCLQIHPLIYPAGSESLPPDIVQHNRNTGARSAGAKPCCSAPVLPAEGWLIAVANEGPVPCNYSSEASLSTLESRGKCGHSCIRRCQAGKEIVLFKRSGGCVFPQTMCFIGQGGGGRVLNAHR